MYILLYRNLYPGGKKRAPLSGARKYPGLVGSCAKFAQNPVMRTHLLDTGGKLLAEAIPLTISYGAPDTG